MTIDVKYQTQARATGGRDGHARTQDGTLDVALSTPKELGGAGGEGTNPEQLFAAGYSACFIGALGHVARQNKQALPEGTSVSGAVGLGTIPKGFGITVELTVKLPGLEPEAARKLVEAAHEVCPYSNATRGNVDVQFKLV